MQDAIVVETSPTFQDYQKYINFHLFRRTRWMKPMLLTELVCLLFIWLFLLLIFEGDHKYPLLFLAMIVLFFGYGLVYLIYYLSGMRNFRSAKYLINSQIRYEFHDGGVSVVTRSENVSGRSELRYQTFYQVFEVRDAFYLYLAVNQAYLIPKQNVGQAPEQLSAFLQNKFGDKFIKRL